MSENFDNFLDYLSPSASRVLNQAILTASRGGVVPDHGKHFMICHLRHSNIPACYSFQKPENAYNVNTQEDRTTYTLLPPNLRVSLSMGMWESTSSSSSSSSRGMSWKTPSSGTPSPTLLSSSWLKEARLLSSNSTYS